jgi:hypothetical protein
MSYLPTASKAVSYGKRLLRVLWGLVEDWEIRYSSLLRRPSKKNSTGLKTKAAKKAWASPR